MRYESPLNANAFRIDEEPRPTRTTEGQRITIRPMAGSAVGANVPTAGRVSLLEESRPFCRPCFVYLVSNVPSAVLTII
jgi:hypothetical protein